MKIPTRLAATIGTCLAALVAYSLTLDVSKPVHAVLVGAGVLLATLGIHPSDTLGASTFTADTTETAPVTGATVKATKASS